MMSPISITAIGSVSALGVTDVEIWKAYQTENHHIAKHDFNSFKAFVASLSKETQQKIVALQQEDDNYTQLDNSVLYAILASRIAIEKAGWNGSDNFGINIGSSRGATELFENYHASFLQEKVAETRSSPTTTLGNISSWVAHDLQTQGPEISHSITCATALHAVLNGIAWLNSGMTEKFLVGGSEAPLTPFTIAQMKALHIYARKQQAYPCLALDLQKTQNTMVLGEGAAVACLEKGIQPNAKAIITGFGYATEVLTHSTSISANGECFQKAMQMAIANINPEEVDVIVMHAPGTIKGDLAEYNAIKKIFCNKMPTLTTNKWKVGHTFGASGMLSIELATLMLQHQQCILPPYLKNNKQSPRPIKNILVNAVGFGGNAVSILLTKNE